MDFDEWYSWCSFNSGDIEHACREAFKAGQQHKQKIKFPKRKVDADAEHNGWDYVYGFNDCLDEIKKLNKIGDE